MQLLRIVPNSLVTCYSPSDGLEPEKSFNHYEISKELLPANLPIHRIFLEAILDLRTRFAEAILLPLHGF